MGLNRSVIGPSIKRSPFKTLRNIPSSPTRGHNVNYKSPISLCSALPGPFDTLLSTALSATPGIVAGAAINTVVYVGGIKVLLKGLTWEGVVSSWLLGSLSYAAFGPGCYFIVCLYFIVGSLVTKLKLAQKEKEGIAEARSGRRGLGSVLGSGFAGIVCAIGALTGGLDIPNALWRIGFIASFASKLADTTSSEVGKAYGKTTYLITSLKRVPRGTEGAVSVEGTLAGLVAGASVGLIALFLRESNVRGAISITAASFVANIAESILGASLQGKSAWLTNDLVNVFQICLASVLSIYLIRFI